MATIRIDDALKQTADFKFKEVGLSTATAVQMFLIKFISTGKFPFAIEVPETFDDESRREMIRVLAIENGLIPDTDKSITDLEAYFDKL